MTCLAVTHIFSINDMTLTMRLFKITTSIRACELLIQLISK